MNRTAIDQLIAALAEHPVTEVYIGGTLETDLGVPHDLLPKNLPHWQQLAPRPQAVLIEVGHLALFSVEVVVPPWEIDVVKLERIEPRFELEDDRFGFIGVLDMTLQIDEGPCHFNRIELFTFCDDDGGVHLASLGLISSRDYIFVEGWRINGLRLGSSIARDAWIADGQKRVSSTFIDIPRKVHATPQPHPPEQTLDHNANQLQLPGFNAQESARD